jgi:uncharacterized protein
MKILYVTDLHGNKWKYEKSLKIALKEKVDLILNGGDMLPFPDAQNQVDPKDFISGYLSDYFSELGKVKIHYFCVLGNDDLILYEPLFNEVCQKFQHIENIANKKVSFLDYEFIGFNLVLDYPFRLKDRCRLDYKGAEPCEVQFGTPVFSNDETNSEIDNYNPFKTKETWYGGYREYLESLSTIEEELYRLPTPNDPKKCFYVIHQPPYRLGLDVCMDGRAVGSQSVFKFLLDKQPGFSLHGHIHESPRISKTWCAKIAETLCVQPGQYPMKSPMKTLTERLDLQRHLTYVLIDLDHKVLKRVDEFETVIKKVGKFESKKMIETFPIEN